MFFCRTLLDKKTSVWVQRSLVDCPVLGLSFLQELSAGPVNIHGLIVLWGVFLGVSYIC